MRLPIQSQRWTVSRKARVVSAIRGGHITIEEACSVYMLSKEEISRWMLILDKHGPKAMRATKVQNYRSEAL